MAVDVFDESKPMWRILLVFLVPLILSTTLQSTAQTFVAIFLGRMLGVNALAAISAIFPIVFLLFSFIIGLSSGSSVLIGQAYGARDERRVKKVAGTMLGATVLFACFTALVGTLIAPSMLAFLGTPPIVLPQAAAYARVIFIASPIIFIYLVYTTFLRGTGDSKTPLWFLIISNILTIAITPAFIRGWLGLPHLGVVSAAVAGPLAQGVALIMLFVFLTRTNHTLRFDREMARDMRIDATILRQIIRIGIPTGIQVIMVSLAEIAIISFVNHFGKGATAAYGAVNQIVGYVQFPAISISIAASIFGAQCIGARREDKLNAVIRSAVTLNYLIGGVLIALCYGFAYAILGWFITDAQTLTMAHACLVVTLWGYLLFGNSAVLSGMMRSSGAVLWPTINGIAGICLVEVPTAYLFMRHFGLVGIWFCYPAYYLFMLVSNFIYYEFFWKKKTHERFV